MSDTKYDCLRCGVAHEWEFMTSTPEGNLFCPACWKKLQSEPKRKCPVDGVEMKKRLVANVILVDVCTVCQGAWFDKGELEVIHKKSEEESWSGGFVLGLILG